MDYHQCIINYYMLTSYLYLLIRSKALHCCYIDYIFFNGMSESYVFLVQFKLYFVTPVSPRVAVVGNVDAGKSTLLGVLTHGELDNGRGFARQKLFRHKHEMESGRTSSVGNDILGFDQEGQVRGREVYLL